jgi:hypothetical protein
LVLLLVWTLTKDARTTTCDAQAHPLGVEFGRDGGRRDLRAEVARTAAAERAVGEEWRGAFEERGWSL